MKKNRYKKEKNKHFFLFIFVTVLGVLSLSVIFGVVYASFCEMAYFKIKEVEVKGTHFVSVSKVIQDIKGKSILSISPAKIAFLLKKNPLIKDISIKRLLPDKLQIIVKEYQPVALGYIKQHFWLIDKGGKCILGDQNYNFDLPIISGLESEKDSFLKYALKLLYLWQEKQKKNNLPEISEIHVDKDLGISIFTLDGCHILLGKSDFEKKLNILTKIVTHYEKRSIKRLDLRDIQRIYAKLG